MTLGEKIRARRKELGMTMDDLGKAIGVQRSAINKYEKNMIKDVKRSTIAALAKALNVSPLYLLDDEPRNILTSRLEPTKSKRLFAMDAMPKTPESRVIGTFSTTETMQRGIEKIAYVPGAEKAELDPESLVILGMLKSAKPEKRKAAIKVLKAMMEDD